jgi:hypothetical protein
MASSIDADLPAEGLAYTADVRSNFAFAKSEISALQASATVVTTRGDIITGSAAGAEQRVAVGAANTVLRSDGTDPAWGKIAVADLASGTDGQLITWDASGVAAVVATGNDTQVLTSNGAGTAPTFQAAGAGDLVASNNLSDVASATTSRSNLGLVIGTNVQAYDAQLADVAGLAVTNSGFIVGNGSNFVLETGATLRTSIGVGTGDSPQFTGIELGDATDTTVTRSAAGVVAVEGVAQAALTGVNAARESFIIAVSDETTLLTTGAAKVTFRMPYAFTLTAVRGGLSTVATGGTLVTVDINEAGSTILSTKLTFDASESTTTTAATAVAISDAALADDALMTIDIDAVGNTTAGKGLKITLIGYKT